LWKGVGAVKVYIVLENWSERWETVTGVVGVYSNPDKAIRVSNAEVAHPGAYRVILSSEVTD
jgi:hypothetical protein